ncbi:hypothetical protein [Actinomadura gamaensis]|uniref:Uncharacterized protein n=1 Tax=Actinomadura gamaensis TaxID=1763541 RepID=A0ABV9U197_9ACTN
MPTRADLYPVRLPGYDGGPLVHRPELLDDRLFWLGHLASWAHDDRVGALLFGADYEAAEDFYERVWASAEWPAFTIPLAGGARWHIVYRTLPGDFGIDYLLHHPSWERAESLASDEGHFMGPALSWPELVTAADGSPPGGSTSDPDARLLLLLPALGDTAVPGDDPSAVARLAEALRVRACVDEPLRLATALLDGQGLWGPVPWTTTHAGVRVNAGGYSYRNPTNEFALPLPRMTRVADTLAHKTPN